MGKVKIWNSGANDWWDVAHNTRIWDGHNWQKAKIRGWDGHRWVMLSEERHVDTWEATWSHGYWSWGSAKPATSLQPNNYLQSGAYNPFHDFYDVGAGHGMMGFNDGDIRNKLAGARIEKVELYAYETHMAYYNKGCTVFGTHNARGWQARFQESNYDIARAYWSHRGQDQWITLPNWVGDNFRDNKLAGITTNINSKDWYYYTIIAGTTAGWKKPKLRITYWK